MADRMKIKILEVKDRKQVGDKGAVKLSFIGQVDGNKASYFTFSKRLMPIIEKSEEIEADVEVSEREWNGETFIDRKVTEIYVDGQPVPRGGYGYQRPSDLSPRAMVLRYAVDLAIADKIKVKDIEAVADKFITWVNKSRSPQEDESQSPFAEDDVTAPENEQSLEIRNLGELFTACKKTFGMTPSQVIKELGYSSKEDIADPQEAWEAIRSVRS